MKKMIVFILIFALAALVKNSRATSPMPEEVKPGMTATVCTINLTCVKERGTSEEPTSTFAFEASEAKKDVLEWVSRYVHDKLNERNVSEFKVDCKFSK